MTAIIDLGLHFAALMGILGIASVALLVLPWRRTEVQDSAEAWHTAGSLAWAVASGSATPETPIEMQRQTA